jgi:hypothetical protein
MMASLRSLDRLLLAIGLLTCTNSLFAADCIPFTEAGKYVGSNKCVRGKVVRVKQGNGGAHFVDFCEDFRTCPFTVVVFAGDLKQIGDVRQLAGREIEIQGQIKEYDGRAEIILQRSSQLHGDAARIPAVPKEYDVERQGKFSAGKLTHAKAAKTAKPRQPARVNIEDPSTPLTPDD